MWRTGACIAGRGGATGQSALCRACVTNHSRSHIVNVGIGTQYAGQCTMHRVLLLTAGNATSPDHTIGLGSDYGQVDALPHIRVVRVASGTGRSSSLSCFGRPRERRISDFRTEMNTIRKCCDIVPQVTVCRTRHLYVLLLLAAYRAGRTSIATT